MPARTEVVSRLSQRAQNGGISRGSGDLDQAEADYVDAAIKLDNAKQTLIKCNYPSRYGVVFLGSRGFVAGTPEYAFTAKLSEALVGRIGGDVITGSGMGIPHAASEGGKAARVAAEIQGERIDSRNRGIRVTEPQVNPHIDDLIELPSFPLRLDAFEVFGNAYIFAPGGVGSLLEIAYPLQLVQLGKLEEGLPVIIHSDWIHVFEGCQKMMISN